MKALQVIKKKVELSDKLTSYGILSNSNSSNLASHSSRVAFLTGNEQNADLDVEDIGVDTKPAAFKKKVQEAEIKITTFFLEHNLPFSIAPELIGLFQDLEPSVINDVKLSPSKMTAFANNVFCAAETDRMINISRKHSFSVYPDETSDIGHEKCLSLVVRYIHPLNNEIRVELLQLINVDS